MADFFWIKVKYGFQGICYHKHITRKKRKKYTQGTMKRVEERERSLGENLKGRCNRKRKIIWKDPWQHGLRGSKSAGWRHGAGMRKTRASEPVRTDRTVQANVWDQTGLSGQGNKKALKARRTEAPRDAMETGESRKAVVWNWELTAPDSPSRQSSVWITISSSTKDKRKLY